MPCCGRFSRWLDLGRAELHKVLVRAFANAMYNVRKDWLGAIVTASLGAGVITSFAVSQGQSPFVGLGITLFAAVAAVAIDHFA